MIHTYPFIFNENIFRIKRKKYTTNGAIYPIEYDNSPLIIQTPTLFIPFGLKYGSIIDASMNDTDEKVRSLKQCIQTIETLIESAPRFKHHILRKSIYYTMSQYPRLLRLYYSNTISIFNEKKTKIGKSFIEEGSHCKFILHIKHVWTKDIRVGIDIKISQILCVNTTFKPNTFAFKDESIVPDPVDERIVKYKKMIKMNIPLQAVKNKMILDGLDPSLLDNKPVNTSIKPVITFNIKSLKKTTPITKTIKKKESHGLPFLNELLTVFKKKTHAITSE
jgi:hypothetical protein